MLKGFLGIFSSLGMKISVGVVALLLIVVGVQTHRLSNRTEALETEHKAAIILAERLATTKVSLDGALLRIRENNLQIAADAELYQSAKETSAADRARLQEAYKSTQASVASLEADARKTGRVPCTVSPVALKALQELAQ